MSTRGADDGNAELTDFGAEVCHLRDSGLEIFKFRAFHESRGECFHIASAHAAIADVSFKHDVECAALSIKLFIVHGDESAHVHDAVLFCAHGHRICIAIHLFHDLADALILIAVLAHFDEICVLCKAC